MVTLQLDGLSALRGRLQDLGKRKAGAITRKALAAAGQVLAKKERELAPRDRGILAKSISKKVKIFRSGVGVAIVGPRTKYRKAVGTSRDGQPIFRQPSRTAAIVERGSRHAKPYPFVGPAAASAGNAAAAAMAGKASEELAKA